MLCRQGGSKSVHEIVKLDATIQLIGIISARIPVILSYAVQKSFDF